MLRPYRRRLALLIGAVAVLLAGGAFRVWSRGHAEHDRVFKIGFRTARPYHFPDEHGNATGPAVDLIRAAAQRKQIRLEWIYSPQGAGRALASGAVDLWPVLADSPGRQALVSVSPPWAKETYSIVYP